MPNAKTILIEKNCLSYYKALNINLKKNILSKIGKELDIFINFLLDNLFFSRKY